MALSRTPLVYVETTVWSFALATDSPDLTSLTLEFFEECRRGRFQPLIGPTVIEEISKADDIKRRALLELVRNIAPLIASPVPETVSLATAFVRGGAVPPSKPDDAAHVAQAFVAGAELLVSWNFKHIASLSRSAKFNAIALLSGFSQGLIITTPAEVLHDDEPQA